MRLDHQRAADERRTLAHSNQTEPAVANTRVLYFLLLETYAVVFDDERDGIGATFE